MGGLGWPVSGQCRMQRGRAGAGQGAEVSRRVRPASYIAQLNSQGRLVRHATRYMPAGLADEVFLHPRSCLASVAPEYVVYGDIVQTAKRPYMAMVTSVEPHWLADSGSVLCSVSEPLSDPAPFYQPEVDAVLAHHDVTYSKHEWVLPRLLLLHVDEGTRAAVFAAALLSGRVLPAWRLLAQALVAPAATAARPELRGLPRVGELLNALLARQVFSRKGLAAAWADDPQFLKEQEFPLASHLTLAERSTLRFLLTSTITYVSHDFEK
eukprot:gene11103-11257_t